MLKNIKKYQLLLIIFYVRNMIRSYTRPAPYFWNSATGLPCYAHKRLKKQKEQYFAVTFYKKALTD